MAPREIRRLSEAEVIRQWLALYAAGKHKGYAPPSPAHYLGRDATWVEVEIPHDLYNADWNDADRSLPLSQKQVDRSLKYAGTSGSLPPGMASYKGRRARGKVFVTDGNHRAYAAYLRGDPAARFYMPAIEWERFHEATRSRSDR